ncbi:hypothetical protein DSO57_1030462 [Entomophthora muscae]|uniref:Uncharacterized protein n=1 Tax=Entomophthora muscae TaxID=34485 RepID=A0ACC2S304_9FUNG|nr:hypothetical protein DSO57_1030462 [Entomophthora muscae]
MSAIANEDTQGRQVLPKSARPTHYVLTLTPDLEKFTFDGHVTISLDFLEATSKIVLNSNELQISHASIKYVHAKVELSQEAAEITYDTKITTATLHFPQEIPAGYKGDLSLSFTGILNDKMNGFYRSSYNDQDGNKRYMATTQFEATDARKAFPCWDEPAAKATFDIVLRVPAELVALSNMNVIEEHPLEGSQLKEVKFATTPIMSTYLLAFIVGDLDFIESHTSGKVSGTPVKCRVYAPRGTASQGQFSLDVCTKTLDLFDEVFGTPYPLPKMDMVAVPDFDAGAMENWGLVTYRTVLLLFDEQTSSAKAKQRIASVVAHELAHQWFGNLVTMEWWSHLWLNEGFATWVGNYAVDKLFPEWDFWTQFVVDDFERGLELDAMRSSHPIEVEVKDPNEISQIFDAISYSKGASVIRMLSAYLSEDVFLAGIRRYLKKHMFGNASTGDLWASLSEESGQDVSKFMTLWTKQVGYPYLEICEEDSGDKLALHIEQKRYLSSGDATDDDDLGIWWVPLGLVSTEQGFKPESNILTEKKGTFHVPKKGAYKLNFQDVGIFRVHYPFSAIQKLGDLVSSKELLTPRDRIGIVADSASLAQSGVSSSADFLELLRHFRDEDNYVVWSQVSTRLATLLSVWYEEPETIRTSLKGVRKDLFAKVISKLGWEFQAGESVLDGLLRALAIHNVGLSGDHEALEEARRRFNLFLGGDQTALHPDLRAAVYQITLSLGGDAEYQALKKLYRETETPDQKLGALAALGFVSQPELISDALNFSISDEVRAQDIIYIMSSLGSNPHSRRAAWAFVKSHWGILEERYTSNFAILGNLIKYTASKLSTEEDAADVEKFFSGKDTSKIMRPLTQTLESIRSNAAWLSRDRSKVESWLASY